MNSSTSSIHGRIRTVFGGGAFTRYMAGEAVSMTGTWMQVMAQGWVMTTLTTSATMLGMVNFCAGIPMVLLSLAGGVAADRHDKRHILLITQVVQITLALSLGWLVATQRIQIWHILLVAVVLGTSNSFEMPAAAALVPELVSRDHIATAIAVDRAVFHGTRLIGPALAGQVIGLWGTASAFFLNALSFVALIVALLSLRPAVPRPPHEEESLRRGIREGLTYVRSDKPTLAMIGLMAMATVFVFPVMVVMLPLYARNELLLGPDKMGLLMGISAVGSLTGSVGLLAIPRERRRRVLLGVACGVALALCSLSLARRFGVAAASLVALSLSVSTLIGLANTIVQERAPGPIRGRVSAITGLSFFGLMPFASLGITGFADWLGMRTALFLGAAAYLTTALAVLLGPGRELAEPPLPAAPAEPDPNLPFS
jgi:MFS family permease